MSQYCKKTSLSPHLLRYVAFKIVVLSCLKKAAGKTRPNENDRDALIFSSA